ncbi:Putative reductase 1 [Cytospora mali]|uniref:Reductase 1 n=1 Tax=Cytospora mali TaxID=578113 RepID=A0A194UPD2_CYTMA|nr:Putative reductase 1 [Valsa mali var. pyri (nom. inval.)]
MAAEVPHLRLNNGVVMPSVGLGCWMGFGQIGEERVYNMVSNAIKAGYRHFDTADGYGNEEDVGRAIRDSGIPRKDVFVTTKLNNSDHHRVKEAFDHSLKALDLEYIDLWLMHWPQGFQGDRCIPPEESPTIHETWAEMVKVLDTGKVRAIGVSNFGVPLLESLLKATTVVPAVNQVELHPFLPRENLRKFCTEHEIVVTAYSPMGQPTAGQVSPLLTDETVTSIAKKYGASEGQVVLSWGVANGIVVIPKSENPERLKANISPGMHRSLVQYHQPDCTVFGWTYEQMGWELELGGKAKA